MALIVVAGGCATATRPVNPPLAKAESRAGYRLSNRPVRGEAQDTLVILAFSGGGTRAAAFSYGVLEALRDTPLVIHGKPTRMLDQVDIVTGVSGGSFTALAYGLYGDRLFDDYAQRFLKRDVQGELVSRFLTPSNWSALYSSSWGRSEMAAGLYDDVLFEHATFADLARKPGPMIIVTATDISTGARLAFVQGEFDIICSDLSAVPLSRAAAASSAVPLVLSPVTLNNYGGTCDYRYPSWMRSLTDPVTPSRPAGRALARYKELQSFQDGVHRPYLHLVDGGLSDNLGMRSVLEGLEELEASPDYRRKSGVEKLKRIVVFVVNSVSQPQTDWDEKERPPNDVQILLKATGVPIDRYSYEAVELLKDIIYRWQVVSRLRAAGALKADGTLAQALDVPDLDLFAIDVSFQALADPGEQRYLNDLPTSFVLTPEQVDRLRAAAGTIVRASPEFQRLLRDLAAERDSSAAVPAAQKPAR
ncbi:MAG: patatin-like phospholipase family protein [Proteobacteria bacterium]|nr:patatin-like phospholipase family protein [Pseudomonadota bacterium]